MSRDIELLGEQIAEQAAHLDAAAHRLLTDLREFDARGGWRTQGASSCAHWLAWRVGWDLVTARDRIRVARKLGEFPAFDDALRRGELSYSKVRALVRIATPATETMLLDQARMMTASQLENTCRKYALVQRHERELDPRSDELRRYVRRRDTEDGMVKIEAILHPEEAELVWAMLDHAARRAGGEPLPPLHAIAESGSTARVAPAARGDSAESIHIDGSPVTPPGHRSDSAESSAMNHATPRVRLPCKDDLSGTMSGRRDSGESTHIDGAPTRISSRRDNGPVAIPGHSSDSAESSAMNHATIPVRLPCKGDLSGTISGQCDSAESRMTRDVTSSACVAHGARPSAATCRGNSSQSRTGLGGDSEESRDTGSSRVATKASLGPDAMRDPHSEIADPIRAHVAAYRRSLQMTGIGRPDSDDEDGRTPAARSFLDRLLDEADALRPIETTMNREQPAATPAVDSSRPPGASIAPLPRVSATRRAFNRADGLVAVAQSYLRGDRPNRSPVQVTVTVPASCLRSDPAAAGEAVDVGCIGESCLSPATARRLSCDAAVIDVIEDEHGVPLSVGRKRRTIAGSIKRALLKRDTSCTFPGCTHRVFLEGHHIQHWANGGATSLGNAVLLCALHHRYVHEYGYSVELGPDGRPRFRDPRGRLVPVVPERVAPADLGWPRIHADNAALNIDANTIACEWDGSQAPYAALIDHLVAADHRARTAPTGSPVATTA